MYLGMLLIIMSYAFYKLSIISLFLIPLFIFYINKFQIEPEEHEMRKKFGKEYEDYCKKVDRWIYPKFEYDIRNEVHHLENRSLK